jgi:hypothetical protein
MFKVLSNSILKSYAKFCGAELPGILKKKDYNGISKSFPVRNQTKTERFVEQPNKDFLEQTKDIF